MNIQKRWQFKSSVIELIQTQNLFIIKLLVNNNEQMIFSTENKREAEFIFKRWKNTTSKLMVLN